MAFIFSAGIGVIYGSLFIYRGKAAGLCPLFHAANKGTVIFNYLFFVLFLVHHCQFCPVKAD